MGFSFRNLFAQGKEPGDFRSDSSDVAEFDSEAENMEEAPFFSPNPLPSDRGNFEALFQSNQGGVNPENPFGKAGGGAQRTFKAADLERLIPPALVARGGVPGEQSVVVNLPYEGCLDVKLSTIYRACPQLFAADITPLNDADFTLPEPNTQIPGGSAPNNPFESSSAAKKHTGLPPVRQAGQAPPPLTGGGHKSENGQQASAPSVSDPFASAPGMDSPFQSPFSALASEQQGPPPSGSSALGGSVPLKKESAPPSSAGQPPFQQPSGPPPKNPFSEASPAGQAGPPASMPPLRPPQTPSREPEWKQGSPPAGHLPGKAPESGNPSGDPFASFKSPFGSPLSNNPFSKGEAQPKKGAPSEVEAPPASRVSGGNPFGHASSSAPASLKSAPAGKPLFGAPPIQAPAQAKQAPASPPPLASSPAAGPAPGRQDSPPWLSGPSAQAPVSSPAVAAPPLKKPEAESQVSPESSKDQQQIKLSLSPLLSGLRALDLGGVSPEAIPESSITFVPLSKVESQLGSENLTLPLADLIDGSESGVRSLLARANRGLRVPVPQNLIFHQLPESPGNSPDSPAKTPAPLSWPPAASSEDSPPVFGTPFSEPASTPWYEKKPAPAPEEATPRPSKPAEEPRRDASQPFPFLKPMGGGDTSGSPAGQAPVAAAPSSTELPNNPFAAAIEKSAPAKEVAKNPFADSSSGSAPVTQEPAGPEAKMGEPAAPKLSAFPAAGFPKGKKEEPQASPAREERNGSGDEYPLKDLPAFQNLGPIENPFADFSDPTPLEEENDEEPAARESKEAKAPEPLKETQPEAPREPEAKKESQAAEPQSSSAPVAAEHKDLSKPAPGFSASSWAKAAKAKQGSFFDELESEDKPESPAPESKAPAAAPLPAMPVVPANGGQGSDQVRDVELRAIFGTNESFDLQGVADRTLELPGVASCVIVNQRGDIRAGRPRSGNGEATSELLKQAAAMFERVRELSQFIGADNAETFTIHTDRGVVSFFMSGERCLTVRHKPGGFDPGVREKLILVARGMARLAG